MKGDGASCLLCTIVKSLIPGFSVFFDRIFANNTDSNRSYIFREMENFQIFYDKTQSLEGVAVSCRHRKGYKLKELG